MMWKIELGAFSYNIVHKPEKENVAPDTFSRVCASTRNQLDLCNFHKNLGHPGITRLLHFVRMKNLPFSMNDVKQVCSQCRDCAKIKPQFYKPDSDHLIKATRPWERISVNFTGPVKSIGKNRYFFTVVDEYNRFPFAFACKDVATKTVVQCLSTLFTIFGLPGYVHSDRGTAFMFEELKEFLLTKRVATSRTTPYVHPTGNAQ